jgi:hypothetical protein
MTDCRTGAAQANLDKLVAIMQARTGKGKNGGIALRILDSNSLVIDNLARHDWRTDTL